MISDFFEKYRISWMNLYAVNWCTWFFWASVGKKVL